MKQFFMAVIVLGASLSFGGERILTGPKFFTPTAPISKPYVPYTKPYIPVIKPYNPQPAKSCYNNGNRTLRQIALSRALLENATERAINKLTAYDSGRQQLFFDGISHRHPASPALGVVYFTLHFGNHDENCGLNGEVVNPGQSDEAFYLNDLNRLKCIPLETRETGVWPKF